MKYLVIAALAVSYSVQANDVPKPAEPVKQKQSQAAFSKSKSSSVSSAESSLVDNSVVNTDASAINGGNDLSINHKERLQAPSISAPAIYAGGPCESGKSLGLAIPGGGISGGKSTASPNCDRREAARVVAALNPALALLVMCEDPYVKEVAKERPELCVYQPVVTKREQVTTAPADRPVTQEQLDRAFKQSQSK